MTASQPADVMPAPATAPPLAAIAWRVRHAIALTLLVAALALAAGRIMRALPGAGLSASGWALAIMATYSAIYGLELGTVWLVSRQGSGRVLEGLGVRAVDSMARWIAAGIGAAVALRVVSLVYSWVMLSAGLRLPGWDANIVRYFPDTPLGIAALIGIVVIGAPVVEETVMRGVLLPAIAARTGERAAVAITAVVFALLHANPFAFAMLVAVGWVLAELFVRSRSLLVAIACHAAFNAIGIAIALLMRGSGAL